MTLVTQQRIKLSSLNLPDWLKPFASLHPTIAYFVGTLVAGDITNTYVEWHIQGKAFTHVLGMVYALKSVSTSTWYSINDFSSAYYSYCALFTTMILRVRFGSGYAVGDTVAAIVFALD